MGESGDARDLRSRPRCSRWSQRFELVDPVDQARVMADFGMIPNLRDAVRTEFRTTDAEGNVRWVEEIAINLLDDPVVGSVVGSLRDITMRVHGNKRSPFTLNCWLQSVNRSSPVTRTTPSSTGTPPRRRSSAGRHGRRSVRRSPPSYRRRTGGRHTLVRCARSGATTHPGRENSGDAPREAVPSRCW